MNTVTKIEHWADAHHPQWIDFLRIILGLFILYKGILFISDTDALLAIMNNADLQFVNLGLAHFVAFAHLVGGLLIAMGLVTRIAVSFQIPILLGAVLFVNSQQGFLSVSNNLEFGISLVVLILLIVFLVYGSGKFSVDHWMKKHPNE
ncbi:putative membrane protein YphA (DoxX/SURF4 family) [Algoriphagus iocasae]|jgi:putative oxidoreductase|uniref:Putative membrane protein YphA (DoxX/SURF4 family) n=1 Tax=Algoriphagus iocasae TaxID=1836499 RepID=A0A841MX12_9BACT|nr:DoxX family protein [Algoriphagus iocasae]MBB6326551.1 putative membrane protein YphA (DoxX/SURF4 family) [Algoriphagus iocasae]